MARPKHGYTLADGTPAVGVTTICGTLNKPALVGWAGKTMHVAGVAHGRACYAAGKAGDPCPALEKWGAILYDRERDTAAAAGTGGHELAQAWLRGDDLEPVTEAIPEPAREGAQHAFESFRRAWGRSRYDLVDMEVPLVSEEHRFGGTYDLLVDGPDGLEVADLKTGGTYPEHLLQLAAYGHLLREARDIEVSGYVTMRIPREKHPDFHVHSYRSLDEEWETFLLLREVYDRMTSIKRRAA